MIVTCKQHPMPPQSHENGFEHRSLQSRATGKQEKTKGTVFCLCPHCNVSCLLMSFSITAVTNCHTCLHAKHCNSGCPHLKHFPYTSTTTLVCPHPSQQQQQHVCDVDRGRSSPAGRPNFDVRLLDFSSERGRKDTSSSEKVGDGERGRWSSFPVLPFSHSTLPGQKGKRVCGPIISTSLRSFSLPNHERLTCFSLSLWRFTQTLSALLSHKGVWR